MKNKSILKIFLVFVFLLGITLLLLEIPKQYYTYYDQKLFSERGLSKYETASVKNIHSFQSKLYSFISYNPDSSTNGIGYTKELTQHETDEIFKKMIREFETMTDGTPEKLIDAMKDSSTKTQCFTAQIFQLVQNEQFIWEVGNLVFSLPQLDVQGRIIYDTDSYKIIMFYLFCHAEFDDDLFIIKQIDETSVLDYYADVSKEIYFLQEPECSIIFPFSVHIEYLEYNSLLKELDELSNYFWNSAIAESFSAMRITDELYMNDTFLW